MYESNILTATITITVFILIAAHIPISAHSSYFKVLHHKITSHLPRSIHKAYILSSIWLRKTELILFGTKRKLSKWKGYTIECEGQTINATPHVKYLGLIIDQHLDGEEMALSIIKKVNSRLKFLYRQARFLDQNIKKILCSALVLCLFDYSISSWYCGINKTTSKKLQVAQNKVIRFILNQNIMYHISEDDFKQLNFLNIQNRAKQLRLNHVFNIFNEIGPEYLRSNFTRVLNSHNHNTRNSVLNFVIPKKSTVISGSFYYNAIMDWSSLPSAIKSISNKSAFKKSVRTHLMNEISCWCIFNHLYLLLSCMLLSNVSLFLLF